MVATIPSIEELKASAKFFAHLEDMLIHYAATPEITIITIPSYEGAPVLDDIADHCKNLMFAAVSLDSLPKTFWKMMNPTYNKNFPILLNAQMVAYGMHESYDYPFTMAAHRDAQSLCDYSWRQSTNPDFERDLAEECFRILKTYVELREYYGEHKLPELIGDISKFKRSDNTGKLNLLQWFNLIRQDDPLYLKDYKVAPSMITEN